MRLIWPEPKWTVWLVPGGLALSGLLFSTVLRIYPGPLPGGTAPALAFGFALTALAMFWSDTRGPVPAPARWLGIRAGLIGGGLWFCEIAFNTISKSLAMTRLVVDNTVWAVVGLLILAAAFQAGRRGGVLAGIACGFWSGTVSGLIACLTALVLILAFMPALLADPIAEYGARVPAGHPGIAATFAYETLTGALAHLVVLGTAMGFVLGAVGGSFGKQARRFIGR